MKNKKPRKPPRCVDTKEAGYGWNGVGFWMCAAPDWGQARLYDTKDIRRLKNYLEKLLIWIEAKERK